MIWFASKNFFFGYTYMLLFVDIMHYLILRTNPRMDPRHYIRWYHALSYSTYQSQNGSTAPTIGKNCNQYEIRRRRTTLMPIRKTTRCICHCDTFNSSILHTPSRLLNFGCVDNHIYIWIRNTLYRLWLIVHIASWYDHFPSYTSSVLRSRRSMHNDIV